MPFATPLGPLLNVVDAEDDDYWRWVLGGGGDDDEDWDGGDDFDYFLHPHGIAFQILPHCGAFLLHVVVFLCQFLQFVVAHKPSLRSWNAVAATAGTCPLPIALSLSTLEANPSTTPPMLR